MEYENIKTNFASFPYVKSTEENPEQIISL